jgi:glycosyltransferase involved in cell wall biosynthesis
MKVSVVIPTFNREEEVSRAIESAVNQTYTNLEIIVVDDYSQDNTRKVVQSVEDDRVQYVLNRRSKGAQGARNTGVEVAGGEWIAFLDSDDVWRKEKTRKQLEFVLNNEERVHSVYSNFERRRSGNVFWKSSIEKGKVMNKERFLFSNPLGGFSSFMVKKVVIEEVGGVDEGLDAFQDRDLYYRICKEYNIFNLSKNLVTVNVDSSNRISENAKSRLYASIKFYDKYQDRVGEEKSGVEYCMRSDVAQYAALCGRWDIFTQNLFSVSMTIFYCRTKLLEILKSILLKSESLKRIQMELMRE